MGKAKKYVCNIDTEDFSMSYDSNGDGNPIEYVVPSKEVASFEPVVTDHIIKHLASKILIKRGVKTNWEADHKKIVEEITLYI